jgi:hypothetical protein
MNVPVTLKSVCSPSEDVVAREIEGDIVIVPLVAGICDAEDELYTLNPTAKAVWNMLDGQRTLGQVAVALIEEFDAEQAEIEADVLGFASEMTRRGILTVQAA